MSFKLTSNLYGARFLSYICVLLCFMCVGTFGHPLYQQGACARTHTRACVTLSLSDRNEDFRHFKVRKSKSPICGRERGISTHRDFAMQIHRKSLGASFHEAPFIMTASPPPPFQILFRRP